MAASRWAIVKCKFSDDESETLSDEVYERFFTGVGAGSMAMADFFRDMSHGNIDVSESRVFGWFTLAVTREECRAALAENVNVGRAWIYDACVQAARDADVNLDGFVGVVAAMNRGLHPLGGDGVDMWGQAGGRVFCDRYSLRASLMGQEMAHGYGLSHSRHDRFPGDYQDGWDTMSTENFRLNQADHSEWGANSIGPGLNAVNMMIANWFDESRLWRCSDVGFNGRIRLRPLHRIDLPGTLAASLSDPDRVGERLFLELRIRRRWDAGIDEPVVLAHRREAGRSYLIASHPEGLRQGEVLEYGEPGGFSTHLRVEVVEIDEDLEFCELDIRYSRPRILEDLKSIAGHLAGRVIGGVPYDGGGAIILPGGGIVPIGPWDPTLAVLDGLGNLHAAHSITDPRTRLVLQREALTRIMDVARAQLDELEPIRSPADRQG